MAEETLKIKIDSSEVDKGSTALDKLTGSSKKAETATDGLTSATALLSRAVAVAAGSYATFKVTQYAQEALILSQRYQELGITMSQIGRNAGVSRTQLDSAAKTLQKLGISMIESRQTVLSLVAANIDLAQAEKLADLARNAAIVGQLNTSQALNSLVHGVRSAQTEVLRNIGINVSFENSYKKLAAEMGVTTSALTEQQRMQGRMNAVLGEGAKLTGLYEQAMGNAGKQYRSTTRLAEDLKVKVGAVFDATAQLAATTYTMILQSLGATVDSLAASGELTVWGDNIARTFAFMGDAARSVIAIFKVVGLTIGATVAQFEAMARFDFAAVGTIQKALNADIKAQTGSMSTMRDELNKQIVIRDLLNVTTRESGLVTKQATAETEQNTITTDKATAAKHRLTLTELRVQESTKRTVDLYQDAKRLTDSVATSQDKYNAELAELNRLRPYVSVGTYDRALAKLNETTVKTANVTKTATDEVSQLWVQAGRNIQSTLANSIFNFFDDGLKGMVKNVGIAVGRILSEFAALRLAQSISLAGVFTAGGASASGGATLGANLLNIASLGTNAASLFKGGLGSMGLMSSIGGMLPGQAGAFFGGMGGGTVAGVSSTASLMGSSFAAVAGPAVALFAVDAIGRMLAGDKKLGGAEYIPVIGGFLAAMFGRGPMEFRQQVAIGEATSEGFDGRVTDVFRAEGGLFVGNKHREQAAANEAELLDLFNTTIKGYADASRGFATTLGLDVEIINGYHKTIRLESEKKKTLTEEAIRDMLTGIGNEMADSLVPAISTLKKAGEDSMATLSRLNSEFLGLTQGAENLGASIGYAKELIMSMSFEARTSFVEAAGGLEALATKTQFFAQNFLTAEEQLAPVQERLNTALTEIGLSTSLTRDEFKNLVQTNDGLRLKLLELAPAYVLVTDAMQASADAADALAKSTAADALAKKQITNNTQRGLEIELMGLQGKTQESLTARRIDELMAMDSSLITLKQAIFRQQDFNTAAEKANVQRAADIDTAKENLNTVFGDIDLAFSALGRAVEADKDKILQSNAEIELKRESATTNYNNALDAQNKTISQFVDSINDLQGFSSSLKSTIESINPMGMEAARSQIESAIKTGNLNTANVASAINILSKTETAGFTNALEFKRAQAKNVQLLNDLSVSTDAQLTLEQRTLNALESARDRLTDSFKIEMNSLDDQIKSNAAELSRLDQIITDAKTQIDVLRGIDVSIISVAAALGNLKTQSAAVGGAQAAVAAAQAVPEILPQIATTQIVAPQITTPVMRPIDISAAISAPFQGPLPGLSAERQAWLNRNIAKFDVGGPVPRTGIAMLHKNEQVLSVDDKDNIGKQIAELKTAVEVLTVTSNKIKRIFEKWEGVGMPATRAA